MRTDFDAVIIGAGPAGASSAILLARAGWSVALVEKQRFPRRKVCGECIAASNLPLLEALGIGTAFDAAAGPELRSVALMRGDEQVIADLPPAPHQKYRWGRALGRETLDTLLLEQARSAGATVLQPWSVDAISGSVGDWHCLVHPVDDKGVGWVLRAPVVIAAHGSWEALPCERASRRLTRHPSDLFAFKANFRNSSLREGLLPVLSFNGGYGGMVVAGGGVTTVACCIRADRLESSRHHQPGARAGEVVETLLRRECAGVREALEGATRQDTWLAAGPIDPGIRLGSVRGDTGIFRIGNAAGEAHPVIGEGMSMALQSAWLLCSRLLDGGRRGGGVDADVMWQREAQQRYCAEWRFHFGPRLRLAAIFASLAARPVSASALMSITKVWPGLLGIGARWSGKVGCVVDPAAIAASTTTTTDSAASITDPAFTSPAAIFER